MYSKSARATWVIPAYLARLSRARFRNGPSEELTIDAVPSLTCRPDGTANTVSFYLSKLMSQLYYRIVVSFSCKYILKYMNTAFFWYYTIIKFNSITHLFLPTFKMDKTSRNVSLFVIRFKCIVKNSLG